MGVRWFVTFRPKSKETGPHPEDWPTAFPPPGAHTTAAHHLIRFSEPSSGNVGVIKSHLKPKNEIPNQQANHIRADVLAA
jgi:hypothetical protein